ncbi:MAG: phosphate/phosphite/phosphonate ABC transporter substrate-binding protein [Gammaproteobacteria bacterium]|nr:phosphate/phosphite/phosphonate ABC transporter substrate-binding protein [Gammaproteobacteria bacterium]
MTFAKKGKNDMSLNRLVEHRGGVAIFLFFLYSYFNSVYASQVPDRKTLIMGVFPIVSSGALFKRFAPLKDYLEQELDRKLVLETAKDFPEFVRRTAKRQYDIVITAPHFSLLATDSGDYKIISRPKRDLVSLLVVPKDSKIIKLSQLSGKLIATPPAPALSTRSGKDYFKSKDLVAEKAPKFKAYKSHNAAYQAALANDAVAALVSINSVNKALDRGIPLRIVDRLPAMPAMPTLVATDLGDKLAGEIERVMVGMEATKHGKLVLKKVGFPGYLSAREKDYESVRPYKPGSSMIGSSSKK